MPQMLQLIMRGVTLLWTMLATAMLGNVIALDLTAAASSRAAVNFAMFAVVVAWLATTWGLAWAVMPVLFRPVLALVIDGSAAVFTFLAAVVLSAKLGVPNCNALGPSLSTDYIVVGADDVAKRCHELQAATAFEWFVFIGLVASLALAVREARASGFTSSRSFVSSRPSMAQVGV